MHRPEQSTGTLVATPLRSNCSIYPLEAGVRSHYILLLCWVWGLAINTTNKKALCRSADDIAMTAKTA